MKFTPDRQLAEELGRLLAVSLPPLAIDFITYIPTDTSRVRQRGFDHAKLIAQAIAVDRGVPLHDVLGRRRHTRQLGSSRRKRFEQMSDTFVVRAPGAVNDKTVLLIDDVFSTGATMLAATEQLKQAGARRIYGAVLAHNR